MQKYLRLFAVTTVSLLLFSFGHVWANEDLATDDMGIVYVKAKELSQKYGVKYVLVVFDNDNTLLAMRQPLGSDQWFSWQSDLLQNKNFRNAVADDFKGLLEAQGLLFSLSKMAPPQADTPKIVNKDAARWVSNVDSYRQRA